MEDTNHQHDDDIERENDIYDDSSESEEELEFEYEEVDDVFKCIKENNPTETGLRYDFKFGERLTDSTNWKEDGDSIAGSLYLKMLQLDVLPTSYSIEYSLGEQGDGLPTRDQLQDFFSGIYRNVSIEKLDICTFTRGLFRINDQFGGGLIEGLGGHHSINELRFWNARLGSIGYSSLGVVLNHPKSNLKELHLQDSLFDDCELGVLCDALMSNSHLKRLVLEGRYNKKTKITSVGWRALSTVLQQPNCKLVSLSLKYFIDDTGADIIGPALLKSSLKGLNLQISDISISSTGTLLNHISQTLVESLNLSHNMINDVGLATLTNISTLKSLKLIGENSITPIGWQSFFNTLQRRGTRLVKLYIQFNDTGILGVASLGTLLSNASTLKKLKLDSLSETEATISAQAWQAFFTSLQGSDLNLEKLSLFTSNIDDDGLQMLVRLVSSMSSLKYLSLGDNQQVTPAGWQALSGFFQSPNFELRELYLNENNINDVALVAFAIALLHNKTLKRLVLEECDDLISEIGWKAVSLLLCNKTSVMYTYLSNHTLQYLSYKQYDRMNLPDSLVSSLKLNGNKDKVEVARQKILQAHFSDATAKMQEFLDMELKVLPIAIAWIGRPTIVHWRGTNVSGLSAMYNLFRRLPGLFDSNAQKKTSAAKQAVAM